MASTSTPLVLGSASPRRSAILESLGIAFEVYPSGNDEARRSGEAPATYALRAAADKTATVLAELADRRPAPVVLGADTVVAVGDSVLGKPLDDDAARGMLRRLSGRTHVVTTALAVGRVGEGVRDALAVRTEVRFAELSDVEIDRYVATGEGRDKAGAYAVQGRGRALVETIAGSYSNVVGMPAAETLQLLAKVGALGDWP